MFDSRLTCILVIVTSLFVYTHAKACKTCRLPTVDDRVCSKDGQTYPSKCYMKLKACVLDIELQVAHKGSCIAARRTPPRRPPQTDPPTTAMPTTTRRKKRPKPPGKKQKPLAQTGECKTCPVPSRSDQVCGIDGMTYPSKCYMKIRGCVLGIHVAVKHKGKCRKETRTPPPEAIVPQIESTTPPTTTQQPTTTTLPPTTTRQYRPENPETAIVGPGRTHQEPAENDCGQCARPYLSDAVCGSDSRTHPSICLLDKLACLTNTNIQPVHMGKCVSRSSPVVDPIPDVPEVEPEEDITAPTSPKKNKPKKGKYSECTVCIATDYGPEDIACGTDGLDYPSACHIIMKACVYKLELRVAHLGACTEEERPKRPKQTFSVVIPEREVESTTPKPPPIFQTVLEEYGSGNFELCGECPTAAYEDIVCGSDGKTYPSACQLERIACLRNKDIIVSFEGECPVEARSTNSANADEPCTSCSLPSAWDQVCGTDDKTYPSECLMNLMVCIKNVDVRVKHQGECITAKPRVNVYSNPTYPHPPADNPVQSKPTQRPVDRCPTCPTPVPSDKVCGNDGITYASRCVLHRRACTRQIRTKLDHDGPCGSKKKEVNSGYVRCTNCPQPTADDMVCGTDGMTYPSECFLEIKACIKRSSLATRHAGRCGPREPNPVITRPIHQHRPKPRTTRAPPSTTQSPASRWGETCSFECPVDFNPVCGTDNLNYPSPCILESFACHLYNPSLQVRHRGLCIRMS